MRKSFNQLLGVGPGASPGQFKLRLILLALVLLNLLAAFFYFAPPGGSQQELAQQDLSLKNQIAAIAARGAHMQKMAMRVETGSTQIASFEKEYFLPKRIAYGAVIEEIQRMAKASGLQERDAGFSEEPIEGTNDLSLLTMKANYEGAYPNLIKFLYETDHSPMFLMLDSLTASPEQKNGQISADIRFQVVIQDQPLAAEQQLINDQIEKEKSRPQEPSTSSGVTVVPVKPVEVPKPQPTMAQKPATPVMPVPVPVPPPAPRVSRAEVANQPSQPLQRQTPPPAVVPQQAPINRFQPPAGVTPNGVPYQPGMRLPTQPNLTPPDAAQPSTQPAAPPQTKEDR